MYRFWENFLLPVARGCEAGVVCEIGSLYGDLTEKVLDFCLEAGAVAHVVEPAPEFDVAAWQERYGEAFVLHRALSLEALGDIPVPDLALIDGDHNWYTVVNELRQLERRSVLDDRLPPVIALHDVGWPYARRDLYYEPKTVPEESRQPYEQRGMRPGQDELTTEGINGGLHNAIHEHGPRNGVLTAVEDFAAESGTDWVLKTIPGLHGLGLLAPAARLERQPALARALDGWDESPTLRSHLEAVESDRIGMWLERVGADRRADNAKASARGAQREKEAAERLAADRSREKATLEQEVSELRGSSLEKAEEASRLRAELGAANQELDRVNRARRQELARVRRGIGQIARSRSWRVGQRTSRALRAVTPRSQPLPDPTQQLLEHLGDGERDRGAAASTDAKPPARPPKPPPVGSAAAERPIPTGTRAPTTAKALREIDQRLTRVADSQVWRLSQAVTRGLHRATLRSPQPVVGLDLARARIGSLECEVESQGRKELSHAAREQAKRHWLRELRGAHKELTRVAGSRTWRYGQRLAVALRGPVPGLARPDTELDHARARLDELEAAVAHGEKAHSSGSEPSRESRSPVEGEAPPDERRVPPLKPAAIARRGVRVSPPPADSPVDGLVSVIALNKDGAPLLDELFRSLVLVHERHSLEVIFVDHASSDDSLHVADRWTARLPLRIVRCADSYTFSYSNNRAAEMASGQYVLFLNNDVLPGVHALERLLDQLREQEVGAVGVRLHDSEMSSDGLDYGRVQHIGVRFDTWDREHRFMRPYNAEGGERDALLGAAPAVFPAVTAAMLLCRRDDFLRVGGFSEDYAFGYEDVDLCLKLRNQLGNEIVSANDAHALHLDAWSRKRVPRETVVARSRENIAALWRRFGYFLRRDTRSRRLGDDGSWTGRPVVAAFAVSEARMTTSKGDFYPALELGLALRERFGWEVRFLDRGSWYDLKDVDVLIVMVDGYDLDRIANQEPGLLKVAWLRNWFERWAARECFDAYDVYLSSSVKGCEYLSESAGVAAHLLRLGTNHVRFRPAQDATPPEYDYVFSGSYWNVDRAVASWLDPTAVSLRGAVVGDGWEHVDGWREVWRGFAPYRELPALYQRTKIVLDDANHVTAPWGSVNNRVFDGLACGALVLTNGTVGAQEAFDGLLPTYDSPEELRSSLQRYAEDDGARDALVEELRSRVLAEHTYERRAEQLFEILDAHCARSLRFAIKVPAPRKEEVHEWGDWHFAQALRREFKRRGHSVRIDILPDWDTELGLEDDVVLVLRGLSRYEPREGRINLMWNISHPDKVSDEEYELYDHVFVASTSYAAELGTRLEAPVTPLLQCTDPAVFARDGVSADGSRYSVLFVGNTRKQFRSAVKDAVELDLPIRVVGRGWQEFVEDRLIAGEHISNDELADHYRGAEVVLNDHWPSMAEQGFVSNRIFDAAASGAFLISDEVRGAAEAFGDALVTYRDQEELRQLTDFYRSNFEERRAKATELQRIVLAEHTFARRSEQILAVVEDLHADLMKGAQDPPLEPVDLSSTPAETLWQREGLPPALEGASAIPAEATTRRRLRQSALDTNHRSKSPAKPF